MYTICKVLVLPLVGSLNWHAQKRRLLKYDNEHFLFLGVKTERSGATRVGKIAERSKKVGRSGEACTWKAFLYKT